MTPTLIEQNQILDLFRRLNPTDFSAQLVPGGTLPYVSGLRVVAQKPLLGGVNCTLAWYTPDDPLRQIAGYRVYAKNVINQNVVPKLLAETFDSPAQVYVSTDGTSPVIFAVQTVSKNGQVNDINSAPTATANVAAPTVSRSDLNFALLDGYQPKSLTANDYTLESGGLVGTMVVGGGSGYVMALSVVFTGVGNNATVTPCDVKLTVSVDSQPVQKLTLISCTNSGPSWNTDIQAIGDTSGTLAGGTAILKLPFVVGFLERAAFSVTYEGGSFTAPNGTMRVVVQYALKI